MQWWERIVNDWCNTHLSIRGVILTCQFLENLENNRVGKRLSVT